MVAEAENQISVSGTLWFPGVTKYPVSARAQEIAKSREELIGLLRDLPESDYELSLTDLVEKKSAAEESVPEVKLIKEIIRKNQSPALRKAKSKKNGSPGILLNVFVPVSLKRGLSRSASCVSDRLSRDSSKREREREKEKEGASPGCWSIIWDRSRSRRR